MPKRRNKSAKVSKKLLPNTAGGRRRSTGGTWATATRSRPRSGKTSEVPCAPNVWQCHSSRADNAGCVAVPLFSRRDYYEWLRNEKGCTLLDAALQLLVWWPHQDSNLEPVDYESIALTVAPWGRCAQASIIAENPRGNSYLLRDKVGASHIAKASVCPPLTHFGYFFIHARLDLKIIGSVGR